MMKKRMVFGAPIALAGALASSPLAALTLDMDFPGSTTITANPTAVGETVEINTIYTGLGGTTADETIAVWDFLADWDDKALQFQSIDTDPNSELGTSTDLSGLFVAASDRYNVFMSATNAATIEATQSADVLMARFEFNALAVGPTSFSLVSNSSGTGPIAFIDGDGDPLPVPAPGVGLPAVLGGLGLMAIALRRREHHTE